MNKSYITTEWNPLDSLISKVENVVVHIIKSLRKTKEEIPDPEEMIAVATEQLQKENDELKKMQYPGIVILEDDKYSCPHCHTELNKELVEGYHIKYCTECGKRIILSVEAQKGKTSDFDSVTAMHCLFQLFCKYDGYFDTLGNLRLRKLDLMPWYERWKIYQMELEKTELIENDQARQLAMEETTNQFRHWMNCFPNG